MARKQSSKQEMQKTFDLARNVRLFDLAGNRLARLPRSSRQGHARLQLCEHSFEVKKQIHYLFTFLLYHHHDHHIVAGWFAVPPGWKKQANDRIFSPVDLTGFLLFFYLSPEDSIVFLISNHHQGQGRNIFGTDRHICLAPVTHQSYHFIFARQVIGWGVQPREPGDEREGFR